MCVVQAPEIVCDEAPWTRVNHLGKCSLSLDLRHLEYIRTELQVSQVRTKVHHRIERSYALYIEHNIFGKDPKF